MAANLGTTVPSTYKLGTSQVSSLYQGTTKVWPTISAPAFNVKLYNRNALALPTTAYATLWKGSIGTGVLLWTSATITLQAASTCYDFGSTGNLAIPNDVTQYYVAIYKAASGTLFNVSSIVGWGDCPTPTIVPSTGITDTSVLISGVQIYAYAGQSVILDCYGLG